MQNLTVFPGSIESGRPESSDLALLGALCLFLSALDHLIPKPLPFMRIGLANLPLLLALNIFPAKKYFALAFVKVLGQALVTGTLFSYIFLFSLAGTALSAVTMLLVYRSASLVGTSIAGAFVSNAVQLILARFIVFGEGVLYLAPAFLAAGIASGGLLGFFAETFSAQSEWLRLKRSKAAAAGNNAECIEEAAAASGALAVTAKADANAPAGRSFAFSFRHIALLLMAAVFLMVPHLPVRAALFLFFWILAIAVKRKTRPVFTIIGLVMITACNLFPPYGKILFTVGPITVAEGSLLRGLQRAVTLEGLIMFSKLALFSIPRLPGKFGGLLYECFGIVEKMNAIFFGARAESPERKTKDKMKQDGNLIKKLDRLLCEISGYG